MGRGLSRRTTILIVAAIVILIPVILIFSRGNGTTGTALQQPEGLIPTVVQIIPTVVQIIPTAVPVIPTAVPVIPTAVPVIPTAVPIIPTAVPIIPTIAAIIPTLVPVIPTVAAIIPTVAQVIPTVVQVIPTVVQVIPTVAQVIPTVVQVIPTVAQVIPTVAQVIPTVVQVVPTVVQVIPTVVQVVPTVVQVIPTVVQVIPTVVQVIPTVVQVIPTVVQVVPTVVQVIPTVVGGIPTLVPTLEDILTDIPGVGTLIPTDILETIVPGIPTAIAPIGTLVPGIGTAIPPIGTLVPGVLTQIPSIPTLVPIINTPIVQITLPDEIAPLMTLVPDIVDAAIPDLCIFGVQIGDGLSVRFSNLSTYGHAFQWDFGDGIASADVSPEHIYASVGNYNVKLTCQGENGSIVSNYLFTLADTLEDTLIAAFNFTPDPREPLAIAFVNASLGLNINTYLWDFGDGGTSTDPNPHHTYGVAGTYNVKLTVGILGGLKATASVTIVVSASEGISLALTQLPTLIADIVPDVCIFGIHINDDLSVDFINLSTYGNAYQWDFGDGIASADISPSHTYARVGDYSVRLTCQGPTGSLSTVNLFTLATSLEASLAASVNFVPDLTNPLNIDFTDVSVGADITAWLWDFGDGTTSTDPNPHHTYQAAGDFTITLNITKRGGATAAASIRVHVGAGLGINATPPVGTPPAGGTPAPGSTPIISIGATVAVGGPLGGNTPAPGVTPVVSGTATPLISIGATVVVGGATQVAAVGTPTLVPGTPAVVSTATPLINVNATVQVGATVVVVINPTLTPAPGNTLTRVPTTVPVTNIPATVIAEIPTLLATLTLPPSLPTLAPSPTQPGIHLTLVPTITPAIGTPGILASLTPDGTPVLIEATVVGTEIVPLPEFPEIAEPNGEKDVSYIRSEPWVNLDIGASVCPNWVTYQTNQDGNWEIYGLISGTDGTNTNVDLSDDQTANSVDPSRSADAKYVTFSSNREGNWEIYVNSVDGSMPPQRVTYNGKSVDTNPVWGPNKNIVYQSSRDGNWELYMFDVANGEEKRLTNGDSADTNPEWSPDGTKIVFQSNREGKLQIYQLDVNTLETVRLSDMVGDSFQPHYSPDGQHIVFGSNRDSNHRVLYTMNIDGTNLAPITDQSSNANQQDWSPNSAMIAYKSDLGGNQNIFAYQLGSGNTWQLTNNGTSNYAPAWDCSGGTLVFTSDVTGNADLFRISGLPQDPQSTVVHEEITQLTDGSASDIYADGAPPT